MNRIVFVKLPKVGRYFEELRENIVRAGSKGDQSDLFQIEDVRALSISGTYIKRRVSKYNKILDNGLIGEEEREVVDIFPFRIDARNCWIELYNPPKSIKILMNRLSLLSSGRLSYSTFRLNVILAVENFRKFGEYKVINLRCSDFEFEGASFVFTGRVVGGDLPESFLKVSGQKPEDIDSIMGVFIDSGSESKERVELRKSGGICISASLTNARKSFYRNLVKYSELM